MNPSAAIDQARQTKGHTLTTLARIMGVTTHTLSNMRHGRTDPRPEHVQALENALGWAPGSYWAIRNGGVPTPITATNPPTPAPDEQLRMVGHLETEHGILTWVEQPGAVRDYTLARDILGTQRSVGLPGSTLSPAAAVEDLKVGLDIIEAALTSQASQT